MIRLLAVLAGYWGFKMEAVRYEQWRPVRWWHLGWWFGYRWKRWTWDAFSIGGSYDGQWQWANDEKVASTFLQEKFEPKAGSMLLFD